MFSFEEFSCGTDIYRKGDDLLVRFYDKAKEQRADQIADLVIVDSGFGFISLKFKGDNGLVGGYLDKSVFVSDAIVHAAIEYVESLSPKSAGAYLPHHIDLVVRDGYVEYNGEY